MNFKKILSVIICLCLTIPLFSCAKKDDTTKKDISDDNEIIDSIPEGYNLNGQVVGLFYPGMGGTESDKGILGDDLATDIVYSKIYERNLKVQSRLNFKLNQIPSNTKAWQDFSPVLRQNIQTLDDSFEIVVAGNNQIIQEKLFSLFQNLNDSNYIDIEEPWWYKDSIMELSVDNYYYRFLYGDNYIGCIGSVGAILYNKDLYSEYVDPGNPDGLYEHVYNGTWTLEQFDIVSENSFVDMGSEENNIHGYTIIRYGECLHHFPIGCGAEYYKRDERGFPVITVYNEKNVDITNKLYELLYNNKGAYLFFPKRVGEEVGHEKDFENNKLMFAMRRITCFLDDDLRQMEKTFGCLPYPKYNEEQEEYISFMANQSNLCAIPIQVHEDRAVEETSAVIEAICSEGYRTVKDAFYDQACKRAYSRDDTTAEMLDIITGRHPTIKSKLTKNFLYEFSNSLGGAGTVINGVLSQGPTGNPNFASYWESRADQANTQLALLIELYIKGE